MTDLAPLPLPGSTARQPLTAAERAALEACLALCLEVLADADERALLLGILEDLAPHLPGRSDAHAAIRVAAGILLDGRRGDAPAWTFTLWSAREALRSLARARLAVAIEAHRAQQTRGAA
jgi:hypothetical protein